MEELNLPYLEHEFLGMGSYATVWKVQNTLTGSAVVMKVIEIDSKKEKQMITTEIAVWRSMSNVKNICQLLDVIQMEESVIMICEYAEGFIDLHSYMSKNDMPLDEESAKVILRQVVLTMSQMLDLGYCHRDIKLENILIDFDKMSKMRKRGNDQSAITPEEESIIKLIDFGMSTKKGKCSEFCGSAHYTAPEVFTGTPFDALKADMWSLGVLTFVMLTWKLPFDNPDMSQLGEQISHCKVDWKLLRGISDEGIDLIKKLLIKDTKNRMTFDEILNHPWINQNQN